MHGYSRLGGGGGGSGSSPPSSPRFRHGRSKSGSWGNGFPRGSSSKEGNSMEKLVFLLMSAVLRRRGLLLFAPLLYISGMLLYMGSLSFDVVSIKNGVVVVHKRAPPGSVYRSPQVFEKLWPFMEAESANATNGTGNLFMEAWNLKDQQGWKPCANKSIADTELSKSNGFLIIEANGGLNQQRLSVQMLIRSKILFLLVYLFVGLTSCLVRRNGYFIQCNKEFACLLAKRACNGNSVLGFITHDLEWSMESPIPMLNEMGFNYSFQNIS